MNKIKDFFSLFNNFHISKRDNLPLYFRILVRAVAILAAFLVCSIILSSAYHYNIADFVKSMWNGVFGTERRRWIFFFEMAVLLGFSIALLPAFKMKYWNCGADGATLMAGLGCAGCMFYLGGKVNDTLLLFISLAVAILLGVLWAAIPAIFKAFFNTNETLFTLMMNYIAIQFVLFFIKTWVTSGTGKLSPISYGNLPVLMEKKWLLPILIVGIVTILIAVYIKFTKHGYELSLVGESENSAKYAGINVKWVIIRTLILSGVICGIMGFLLVCGYDHTVSSTTTGSRGFTGIIVTWMAGMNPIYMVLASFFVVFVNKGTGQLITDLKITSSAFQDIIIGIFFFFIIGCEFFVRYKISYQKKTIKNDTSNTIELEEETKASDVEEIEEKAEEVNEASEVLEAADESEVEEKEVE